jgi:AraC-like DNA-binding protein
MPKPFFDYFPVARHHRLWGIYATSFGQVHVSPGCAYPPTNHPKSHSLRWEKGRVLNDFQLVYVSEGAGQFESAHSPLTRVGAGALLVLFPGVWHRYRPDPAVGWTEYWIELQGSVMESLCREKILAPAQPVHLLGLEPEILATFAAAGQLARSKPSGFQVRLGLLGLQILPHLAWPRPIPGSPSQSMEQIIRESLNLLAAHLDQPLSPEAIARDLGVGYSYYRRAFKAQTGFSPKQYRLEIRFRRACDFLRNTDLMIKEIAERLGYNSPYHASTEFKKRTGLSPQRWREREQTSARSSAPRSPLK